MSLRAINPGELRAVLSGGAPAMAALERRISDGTGDLAMELYQLADRATADALLARAARGDAVHVLGDARLTGGIAETQLQAITAGGSWRTYGIDGDQWQHAKTYHFAGANGPEAWITNLAPIPDTVRRTELGLVLGGDAAAAARSVTDAELAGRRDAVQGAIDAATGHGILYNDPLAARSRLSEGIVDLLEQPGDDLLVVTKGIEHAATTDRLIAAHGAGRDVRVLVRDLALEDGRRLADAGVPTWIVGGGLKPRVNAVFAGDRGIVGTAFMWRNMVGDATETTSRDVGVLVDGAAGRDVRAAALATIDAMPAHQPLADALRAGTLLEHI